VLSSAFDFLFYQYLRFQSRSYHLGGSFTDGKRDMEVVSLVMQSSPIE